MFTTSEIAKVFIRARAKKYGLAQSAECASSDVELRDIVEDYLNVDFRMKKMLEKSGNHTDWLISILK